MFRRSHLDTIKPGTSFRQRGTGRIASTATVLNVVQDSVGIPHVHFVVSISVGSGAARREGIRMLAIDSFAALYSEPVLLHAAS